MLINGDEEKIMDNKIMMFVTLLQLFYLYKYANTKMFDCHWIRCLLSIFYGNLIVLQFGRVGV